MVQTSCLVPLNETCSPQTILILPICYCPMCPILWDRVQLNWTWFFSRQGAALPFDAHCRAVVVEYMDRAQVPTVNFLIQNLHLTQSEPRKIGSNLKWGSGVGA